jgi:hypothetical protein
MADFIQNSVLQTDFNSGSLHKIPRKSVQLELSSVMETDTMKLKVSFRNSADAIKLARLTVNSS